MSDTRKIISRHIVADRDGMIEHLTTEHLQYQRTLAKDPNTTRRNRDRAAGCVEGLELAIRALQDWEAVPTVDGPEIPWPKRAVVTRGTSPVTCRCGYGPTTQRDLDEHVVAMMSDPEDHGEA